MFNFMKKGTEDEKERRKRDKKLRKEAKQSGASGSMSAEELLRLDEVRRSLKIRGRRKEKEKLPSGITADYSSFFANIEISADRELDRGTEEITANTTTYIDSNGDLVEKVHLTSSGGGGGGSSFSHSDTSSETSNNSTGNKVSAIIDNISFTRMPHSRLYNSKRHVVHICSANERILYEATTTSIPLTPVSVLFILLCDHVDQWRIEFLCKLRRSFR